MKSTLLASQEEKTYILIFSTGEEVVSGLTDFARRQGVGASHLTAIGAFRSLTLGYFDWERKEYRKIAVGEQVEVLSLVGDIVLEQNAPKLHAHVVVGKADGTAHGGHLLEAQVRPTLEVVLVESPKQMRRTRDPESGLALINVDTVTPHLDAALRQET
jgi:uncharacterized protein